MILQIVNRQKKYDPSQISSWEVLINRIFAAATQKDWIDNGLHKEDISLNATVYFVGTDAIRKKNLEFRNISKVTDVLSFPMLEMKKGLLCNPLTQADFFPENQMRRVELGDILICPAKADLQAERFGHSLDREIAFLFLHGLLHLLGFDHENTGDEEEMLSRQREILSELNILRGEEKSFEENEVFEKLKSSDDTKPFKASDLLDHVGYIAILGRPNTGKSTLVNYLSGMKLAIVSPKPQTTRTRIRFVVNLDKTQMIFFDTPGIHKPKTALSDYMVKTSFAAASDADVILFLVDALKGMPSSVEREVCRLAQQSKKKIILAINKVDAVPKEELLPLMQAYYNLFSFEAIIPISARTGDGVEDLLLILKGLLPPGHAFYDKEEVTDQSERMLSSELIREQLLRHLKEEIPYGTAVEIEEFTDVYDDNARDEYDRKMVRIKAAVYCDRSGHKGIILGKNGQMIKSIGSRARQNIEQMCGCKVYLELFVKVRDDWKNKEVFLKTLGYSKKG